MMDRLKKRNSPTTPSPTPASKGDTELATADGASLSREERAVLAEAIERARAVHDSVESAWTEFGRWIFSHVFGDDTAAALEHRDDNPVWSALYSHADSAKVRVRHDDLEHATLCAAYDKRLNNDAWRALDFGRKRRLLKLAGDKLLRKGAQHVLSANLDTRQVEAYVRNVLAEQGDEPATRVNVAALVSQLSRMTERMSGRAYGRQLESAAKKLSDEQRDALLAAIDETRVMLEALHTRIEKG